MPYLLAAAVLLALTHVADVLLATPVWRFAEPVCLAVLLVYALVAGPRSPRWALPAALGVLLVDAVRTIPPPPSTSGYAWQVLKPSDGVDVPSGFEAAAAGSWAPIVALILLAVVWWRGSRPSWAVLGITVTMAILITGYAAYRVIVIGLGVRDENAERSYGQADTGDAVTAVVLAVLPGVVLALAALTLTALLARDGHRLGAAGAFLPALAALPLIDAGIGAVSLPFSVHGESGLFGWSMILPTLSMPAPVPALTAALMMTAFLLLAAGLTARRAPAVASHPARRT